MAVVIGVLRETAAGETRAALVPEVAKKLAALGAAICAEHGVADAARIPDSRFEGVEFLGREEVVQRADVLLTVNPPPLEVASGLKAGAVVIGLLQPYRSDELIALLRDRKTTSFAMELVPRISRAQSMDALSSQAAAAGYRAVLIAAMQLDKFFPMLTTAAGTIRPAKVLVIGAGVAGLQAIATAKRLGAVVEGYDVRAATREQVQSLGAKFVDTGISAEGSGGYARELTEEERAKQAGILADHVAAADVVVTTAAIPGRAAPRIIDAETVGRMQPGSVIVDLAAETGGNCELTRAGEVVDAHGVQVVGPVNLPAALGRHASEMYAKNLFNFLSPAIKEGALALDWEDEVFAGSVLTHDGEVRHGPTRERIEGASGGQG
ncbi:NAD(P) transhydrogenase subunit alpha [Thioalkalivibrio sp. XN8]|uniref:NAD(P) transhydrogenase subunit alpha n=1 Tax=Thioalkalivibrio sp. XN8 TaxID=2712863 RepID=UPI0013EC4E6B|nr:NAD(P) transhydrogenase subunit alpha [Thioalkalivibrio sp. XN8]NGP53457.1 NAD(P) transhydrogenase subunit alpha [Thioalkalivibrio sp. XN8]